MWCIPPDQDATFVADMEQVLEVYRRPHDPRFPVVNMDEQPVQLVSASRSALPMKPGCSQKIDYEYVREGTCVVWMFVDPLGGWRSVRVSARRTAVDWAHQVRDLIDDPRYGEAERITLVCDQLNTHKIASFYEAFAPTEAMRLIDRLDLVHTPKHGSWLNMAEPELSVLTRQSLGERIKTQNEVARRVSLWTEDRNQKQTGVNWQFTTEDARVKLKHLYPKIEV